MKKIIIVRYCEIHLKGKNRGFFERLLQENVQKALADIPHSMRILNARYLIENFNEDDYAEIEKKLLKVPGIHSFSPAYVVKSDLDEITECVKYLCDGKAGEFKVETNRADKTFPMTSVQVSCELGGRLLDFNPNLTVNVVNPQFVVSVDMRESGETLIYTDVVKGIGGLPTGSSGKGVLMLSGGIDSPVAGFMLARRGMRLDAVHFHSYPYTSEAAKEKVETLCKMVSEYAGSMNLYVVKFTHIQEEIHEKCPEELMITMMRRLMMRITEKIASSHGGQAIITGESLGQVASQTIESITSSNSVVKMPVLRPLIALDKLEIIEIANKIGTYDTSILPYEDCCTIFLPKFPAIKPKMETILKAESALDVETLVNEAIENLEVIKY